MNGFTPYLNFACLPNIFSHVPLSHLRPFTPIFPLMFQKNILSVKFFHSVQKDWTPSLYITPLYDHLPFLFFF